MMTGDIIQAVSAVAVVVTLFFLAIQTNKLQKQTDISNLIGRYETLNHSSERYDNALALMFERPEIRPYIYERKPLDLVGEDLDRALIVADMMAGAVDYAIRVQYRFPDETTHADWVGVARDMARQPLFQKLFSEIQQFPDLVRHIDLGVDAEGPKPPAKVPDR
jgi:hypothetical protein